MGYAEDTRVLAYPVRNRERVRGREIERERERRIANLSKGSRPVALSVPVGLASRFDPLKRTLRHNEIPRSYRESIARTNTS